MLQYKNENGDTFMHLICQDRLDQLIRDVYRIVPNYKPNNDGLMPYDIYVMNSVENLLKPSIVDIL